jgi:DNA-directed RNA polymerase subunit RPC12/RpoP
LSKCPYCPRTACVRAWDGEYVCQVCHKEMEDEFNSEDDDPKENVLCERCGAPAESEWEGEQVCNDCGTQLEEQDIREQDEMLESDYEPNEEGE